MLWMRAVDLLLIWFTVGIAQLFVLQMYLKHATIWTIVSAMSGALSDSVGLIVESAETNSLLVYAARWTIYGALTGVVIVLAEKDRLRSRRYLSS